MVAVPVVVAVAVAMVVVVLLLVLVLALVLELVVMSSSLLATRGTFEKNDHVVFVVVRCGQGLGCVGRGSGCLGYEVVVTLIVEGHDREVYRTASSPSNTRPSTI